MPPPRTVISCIARSRISHLSALPLASLLMHLPRSLVALTSNLAVLDEGQPRGCQDPRRVRHPREEPAVSLAVVVCIMLRALGSCLLIVVVAVVLLAQRCHLWASALGPYFFIETVAAPPYTLVSPARFSLQNTLPEACSTAARSVLTNRDCRADAKCYDCNEGGCQGT